MSWPVLKKEFMAKSKKTAKPAGSKNSPETSKPSSRPRVRVTEELLEQLRRLSKEERKEVGEAMNTVQASWGQPHAHAGISIRRLTKSVFECRVGLDQRLAFLFITTPPELVFFFIGNHELTMRSRKSRERVAMPPSSHTSILSAIELFKML